MVVPSTPERRSSSVPLTGDSQTDSDILAFIKARQNILQKKCKCPFLQILWPFPPCSPGKAGASSEAGGKQEMPCTVRRPRDWPGAHLHVPGLCILLEKAPRGSSRSPQTGQRVGSLTAPLPAGQLPLSPVPKASAPWLGPHHTRGLSGGLAPGESLQVWPRQ